MGFEVLLLFRHQSVENEKAHLVSALFRFSCSPNQMSEPKFNVM